MLVLKYKVSLLLIDLVVVFVLFIFVLAYYIQLHVIIAYGSLTQNK